MFRDFVRQMELNRAYDELKLKNAEINQRNFEMVLQKEKLEELNELKDRIFMIISRDFRTPLHSLKGLIFLLNGSDLISPEEFRTMLKGLKHNVDQTHDLLENVQLWSRSQVKEFSIVDQKVNVQDLVLECCDLVSNHAGEKGVVILNFVDDYVFVKADEEMVRLVLRNLISNAIDRTEKGGRIIVRSSRENRSVNVSVIDAGSGMDLEQLTNVFAHAPATAGFYTDNGKGLRLMICKELIEKNNGRIWFESEKGKGNMFAFSLPAIEEKPAFAVSASPKSSR